MSLFRKEVFEYKKHKLHGDVFLAGPVSFKIICGLLTALFVFGLTVILTGTYTRTERVPGYLVPTGGLVKIQAGRFGTVKSTQVNEGDLVRAGDIILEIEIAQLTAGDSSVEAQSLVALDKQRQNLENQVILEENQLLSEQSKIRAEMESTRLEIDSLKEQIALQKEITASAEAAYEDVQELISKGYISKSESERRRQAWLGQQAQEKLRQQELEAARARMEQFSLRLKQLPVETDSKIARLRGQIIEISTREVEFQGRETYVIKAPVSGRITSITAGTVGQSVLPQQPILTIVPENSRLTAELFVPSRAIGFVEKDQDVRLLYAAFPYQRFGSFPAKVSKVTSTILSPDEVFAPFKIEEPVYRVTANLASETVAVDSQAIALHPGMQLEANIILEERTFLDWLLAPLNSLRKGTYD